MDADKKCLSCGKKRKINNFYTSYNSMHSDGRLPYCKKCIKKLSTDANGDVVLEDFKEVLRQVDRPFLHELYNISVEDHMNTVGCYFKNIAMRQYRTYTWENSIFEKEDIDNITNDIANEIKTSFKVTKEMIHRWGSRYTTEQIRDLEQFYNDMKMTHSIVTPQHDKALILLSKMQLKLDLFLEDDNMTDFQKLHSQYQTLLQSSGLRPIDKVGGDEATGMRSFSHIYEEVEKDGFIKPAPIKENQDIIDRTIQYIMNYTLKLLNQQALVEPPADTPKMDDSDV